MILADTTVAIAYERSRSAKLRNIINKYDAALCGISVAEMFAGVRKPKDLSRCKAAIADFRRVPIPEDLWELVGQNQALLQSRGINVQLPDTTIASVAIASDIELWHYDAHFPLIQTILLRLKLFQEPP